MRSLFNYDGKFFRTLGKIGDLIILNIIFIVTCIPIFTIGASMTALYGVTMKMAKNEEGYIVGSYFSLFKQNFKQSTVMWMILLFIILLSAVDIFICSFIMEKGTMTTFITVFMIVCLVLLHMMLIYAMTLQCTFENTIKYTMLNALILTFQYLPLSLVLVMIHISPLVAVVCLTKYLYIEIMLFMLIWCALAAYMNSMILNIIYKKYIEE